MKLSMDKKRTVVSTVMAGLILASALHAGDLYAQNSQIRWPQTVYGLSGNGGTALRYEVKFPSGYGRNNLRATLLQEDAPEVYIKYGAPPTKYDYDCRSRVTDVVNDCRIDRPKGGIYHVMVLGRGPFSNASLDIRWDSAFAD